MRVRLQAQCLQKCSINSQSVYVWVLDRMLSKLSISRMCKNDRTNSHSTHAWVYIPNSAGLLEGFDRWSEGSSIDHNMFERWALTSKDHPSRSNQSNYIFRAPRRISKDLERSPFEVYCSKPIFRSPRRINSILRGYPSMQTNIQLIGQVKLGG